MAEPDERFQALLDVRHDDEVTDDRIRGFRRDDARLGKPDVAPADNSLLGVADRGALHRTLHRTRTAAGAHIQTAQTQFVSDLLRIIVFLARDRVTAPAHDQIRAAARIEHPRVAQDAVHGIGDAVRFVQVETTALDDFVGDVDDVTKHGEQMLLDPADHLSIDESRTRCASQVELDSRRLRDDLQLEIAIALEQFARIVAGVARIEHRERTTAQQRIKTALAPVEKLCDFLLRQKLQAATRPHNCVDMVGSGARPEYRLGGSAVQGRISIGVSARVSSHTSSMSSFDSAMQPLVQSLER